MSCKPFWDVSVSVFKRKIRIQGWCKWVFPSYFIYFLHICNIKNFLKTQWKRVRRLKRPELVVWWPDNWRKRDQDDHLSSCFLEEGSLFLHQDGRERGLWLSLPDHGQCPRSHRGRPHWAPGCLDFYLVRVIVFNLRTRSAMFLTC